MEKDLLTGRLGFTYANGPQGAAGASDAQEQTKSLQDAGSGGVKTQVAEATAVGPGVPHGGRQAPRTRPHPETWRAEPIWPRTPALCQGHAYRSCLDRQGRAFVFLVEQDCLSQCVGTEVLCFR